MKKHGLLCIVTLVFSGTAQMQAAQLQSNEAVYHLNEATGAVEKIIRKSDNETVVTHVNNIYQLMAKSGDITGVEADDRVQKSQTDRNGTIYFECINAKLPGFRIGKRYSIINNSLRRELTFFNDSKEKKFIIPFTESHFTGDFKKNSYYFGAGYLGPFMPAPKVATPTRVDTFVQSSKGMVMINTASPELGSYANVRVKINDNVVFPWWQSTIGRYREMDDRLYYLPDGWRMALGCLDMEPDGGKIRYTDIISFFKGDLVYFFNNLIVKDPDFSAVLKKIPPVHKDANDILTVVAWGHEPYLKYLSKMTDDGYIMFRSLLSADWGDYRWHDGFNSRGGGFITGEEVRDYVKNMHDISPRIKMSVYSILIGTDEHTPLFKEHPEWFRTKNRTGDIDPLFPGMFNNFQSMLNIPECRNYLVDNLAEMSEYVGTKFIYLDEAQQQNTINWQTMELIRDDHYNMTWQRLRNHATAQKKILFFNGSGNPYADINYMESSPRQMNPANWREFAGIALGLELASLMRPDSRLVLLYWKDEFFYMSHCLALGWLPSANPGVGDSLPKIRAVYETGKTLPVSADYTPDWKKDYSCEIESFSVKRRNSNDVLISFINRKNRHTDLPVTLNLASLGFDKNTDINLWGMTTATAKVNNDYALSDKESRSNYQNFNWNDRTITAPQLLYSGKADGVWKHTFHDMKQKGMIQLLITPSPVGIFSCNDLVQNYFHTVKKDIAIFGSKVVSNVDKAELIFADTNRTFSEISANGKILPVKNIDLGGVLYQLVTIPKGESVLSWKTKPRTTLKTAVSGKITAFINDNQLIVNSILPRNTLFVIESDGIFRTMGTSPFILPVQYQNGQYTVRIAGNSRDKFEVRLINGKKTVHKIENYPLIPESTRISPENISRNGVKIIKSAIFNSSYRKLRNLQNHIPHFKTVADAKNMRLVAGTTRKEDTLDTHHYAGFEIENAENLQLKFTNTFFDAICLDARHVYSPIETLDFSGFVVDYRVKGSYTKRVCFSVGLGSAKLQNQYPRWGCNKIQDEHISLGILINKPEKIFSLNLREYAPENWDGTVFFAIGNNHINPKRQIAVDILSANRPEKIPFIHGFNLNGRGRVHKVIPRPLEMRKVKKRPKSLTRITPSEWQKWSKISSLLPFPGDNATMEDTQAYLAYDADNLYIGVNASEKFRVPMSNKALPFNNDCIEVYFNVGSGKNEIIQIVIDASGRKFVLPAEAGKDLIITTEIDKDFGYYVFVAVPWETLKIKDIIPGRKIPFNLARTRIEPGGEKSSWGPVRKDFGFRDVQNFGSIIPGIFANGLGKYEEFFVE